jgi:hypothetical protein
MDSLEARGVAMEDATNERRQADINAINAQASLNPFNQHNTADSTYESQQEFLDHYNATGERRPNLLVPKQKLKYMRNPDTNVVEVFQENPNGPTLKLGEVGDVGIGIDDRARREAASAWDEAATSWMNEADYAVTRAASKDIRRQTMMNQIDIIRRLADKAAGMGVLLSGLPGSDYKQLEQALSTLSGIIGFNELRAMKESGATLGQIAVVELQQLNRVQGSLDMALPAESILSTVDDIEMYVDQMESSLDAYTADQIARYGTRGNRVANPYGAGYKGPGQSTQAASPEANNDPNIDLKDD